MDCIEMAMLKWNEPLCFYNHISQICILYSFFNILPFFCLLRLLLNSLSYLVLFWILLILNVIHASYLHFHITSFMLFKQYEILFLFFLGNYMWFANCMNWYNMFLLRMMFFCVAGCTMLPSLLATHPSLIYLFIFYIDTCSDLTWLQCEIKGEVSIKTHQFDFYGVTNSKPYVSLSYFYQKYLWVSFVILNCCDFSSWFYDLFYGPFFFRCAERREKCT